MTSIANKILTIDMEKWPDTWEGIKQMLKHPEKHFEKGWIDDIEQAIESNDPDIEVASYEIDPKYTHNGNPTHVWIPVVWID